MPDRIDAYVSQPHYADHLWPILDALPDELRGVMYAPRELRAECARPIEVGYPADSTMPLLTAGYQDLRYARRPKVLLNHGAGQRYDGVDSPSYAGGPGREAVSLFLCPNEETARREQDRYPMARAVAIGCPKLDAWRRIPPPYNAVPVIAVTFHWNSHIGVPEGSWAWPTWRGAIEALAARGVRMLGHCHPRSRRELQPWWEQLGVEYVPHAIDLLPRADVLVLDNSSLGYEWAALDRPTVWLQSADWRRDVRHGLRFGEKLPGPDLPPSLVFAQEIVDAANTSMRRFVLARMEVANRVYQPNDGLATQRAVTEILKLLEG